MSPYLSRLEIIDKNLFTVLIEETLNIDEIGRLLIERRQCLEQITMLVESPEKNSWDAALNRTEQIVCLIKKHRDGAAVQVSRFIKGRKSVQIYKKFE